MRDFQRQCLTALNPIFEELAIQPQWQIVECTPNNALGHEPGDVYCRARFEHAGHIYDLFVYTDEAGAYIDGQWFMYERPDSQNRDRPLIDAFTRFIQICFAGTRSEQAYHRALSGNSTI